MMNSTRFRAAQTFEQMIAGATENGDLWRSIGARATVSDEAVRRVEALGGHWHIAALSADWCFDSLGVVPYVAALAARASNVDLRVFERDANPDLMDAHLTDITKRAIPVIMTFDDQFEEHGWWASRPQALQQLVDTEWKGMPKDALITEKRRWYAQDRGKHSVEATVALFEAAARAQGATPLISAR